MKVLTLGGFADIVSIEYAGIEFVHFERIHPQAFAIEPQLDLLRDQLRNAGHGAYKNIQFESHQRLSPTRSASPVL